MNPYTIYLTTLPSYTDTLSIIETTKPGYPAPRKVNSYKKVEMKYKAGRNESCPCNSGKKFKHCCINKTKE